VRHGPFSEKDFIALPEEGYSLLVTDCEKTIPELKAIVEKFRFIPAWRIDDLIISYAPAGGSVGAHIDQFNMFLLQVWYPKMDDRVPASGGSLHPRTGRAHPTDLRARTRMGT